MGFGAPGFPTSASGGPLRLLFDSFGQYCHNFTEGNSGSGNGAQSNKPKSEEQAAKSEKKRDTDSSELEREFDVGASGMYKDVVKNNRKFSRGPGNPGHKGVVEADHMPPKDSLKKAAKEPLIWILGESEKYEGLLKMLQTKDPKGRNLFTLQVLTGQHRTALTTGNSRESVAVRAVLANAFATGQVVSALKLTFLVSHPISSMELREKAGIQRDRPEERGDSGENFAHALSCDTVTFKLIELLQEYGTGCGLNSKSFVYGEKFFIAVEDALVFIRWPV
ncbi:unnamed protein product [Gadus morhua 'NCC']